MNSGLLTIDDFPLKKYTCDCGLSERKEYKGNFLCDRRKC